MLTTAWKFSEIARAFGYRVFYGDATRLDPLRIVGAEHARVLVVGGGRPRAIPQDRHPGAQALPAIAGGGRARDLTHWNELRDLGVTLVQRELFESSLASARTVLELMGQSPTLAQEMTRRFREHNIALADRMYPHHKDRAKMVAVAREGRAQLAEQMAKERQEHTEREARRRSTQGMAEWRMLEKAANLPTPVIQIK